MEKNIKILALNFAYGLNPILRNGAIDGIKLSVTGKEQKFSGLVNKVVGQEIEYYFFKKKKRGIKVAVANDTVCLLLSIPRSLNRYFLASGIVGAGTNFAFFLNKNTIVTLESGNFDKFPQTQTGKTIDKNSHQPGRQLFEKEVSGAYLYQHYNILINCGGLKAEPITDSKQLSFLAEQNKNQPSIIAQKILERSASLIACHISGLYFFKHINFNSTNNGSEDARFERRVKNAASSFKPTIFIMDGSLFWHGWHYKQNVEKYLRLLNVPKNSIKFIKIKNSEIIGASRLVAG